MQCWQPLPVMATPLYGGFAIEMRPEHIIGTTLSCTICNTSFKQGHTARFTLPFGKAFPT